MDQENVEMRMPAEELAGGLDEADRAGIDLSSPSNQAAR
jgi:hypothetical protein